MIIAPQPGFQEQYLSSSADITIGGSGAGVGKTYALLLEASRNLNVAGFSCNIFRRTYPQITMSGGLWEESFTLFKGLYNGDSNESKHSWSFSTGSSLQFSHLQHEKNIYDYQGSQIALLGWDELTHFSRTQFFYLLSRNRSTCGVLPYVRATCNPDPDSWVALMVDPWIAEDGFPDPKMAGKVLYMMVDNGVFVWGKTKKELIKKIPHIEEKLKDTGVDINEAVKSVEFIPGKIKDNQKLLEKNPNYIANLMQLPENERSRLLDGNWKVRVGGDGIYKYDKIHDMTSNSFIEAKGRRCITADVALHGSDKFVIFAWHGNVLIDCEVMPKSDGKEVLDKIEEVRKRNRIQRSNVLYDADGVGAFLQGWLKTAIAFKNGSKPLIVKNDPQEFKNLKTQCYYKSGDLVNRGEYYISDNINSEVRDQLMNEMRYIKRDKIDEDGKLCMIAKSEIKNALGHSPDFADAFAMHAYFSLIGEWI